VATGRKTQKQKQKQNWNTNNGKQATKAMKSSTRSSKKHLEPFLKYISEEHLPENLVEKINSGQWNVLIETIKNKF